jgi:predicted nucleic acid-binding protein
MAAANPSPGLTDTDILIDGSRRLPQAVQYLAEQQSAGALSISIVSAMELIAGCRDKAHLAHVQAFVNSVRVLPITETVSRTAYQLMGLLHLSHGLLLPDALIAATCLSHHMRLQTRNLRHFQMIEGLTVEAPY